MDLLEHKKEFDRIVKENNFFDENKAKNLAQFLTKQNQISIKDFSKKFNLSEKDSKLFLTFVHKGIQFKQEYIDRKQ